LLLIQKVSHGSIPSAIDIILATDASLEPGSVIRWRYTSLVFFKLTIHFGHSVFGSVHLKTVCCSIYKSPAHRIDVVRVEQQGVVEINVEQFVTLLSSRLVEWLPSVVALELVDSIP